MPSLDVGHGGLDFTFNYPVIFGERFGARDDNDWCIFPLNEKQKKPRILQSHGGSWKPLKFRCFLSTSQVGRIRQLTLSNINSYASGRWRPGIRGGHEERRDGVFTWSVGRWLNQKFEPFWGWLSFGEKKGMFNSSQHIISQICRSKTK